LTVSGCIFRFGLTVNRKRRTDFLHGLQVLHGEKKTIAMARHTILVIDDEAGILNALKRALRQEPYEVLTAQSAAAGLALLKQTPVHLVLSDQNMPAVDGLTLLKLVQQQFPAVLTIMLTGNSDIDVAVRAINEAGVYKFIRKPWDDEELKITIRRALESLDLILERDRLLKKIKQRDSLLHDLENRYPGITQVKRDKDGYIID